MIRKLIALILLVWVASGIVLVRANEVVVARRFGRLDTNESGAPRLRNSGLHFELPWPLGRVDRINLNEIRTLKLGAPEPAVDGLNALLLPANAGAEAQFLTGDRNIIHLSMTVQYRISPTGLRDYLTASADPESRLRNIAQAAICDTVARCGVDYVHPLGVGELQQRLTNLVAQQANELQLGLEIDSVSFDAVYPPLRVKADFLDVANARADYERYIESARSYAEQKLTAAHSEARQIEDTAQTWSQQAISKSRARSDSLLEMYNAFASAGDNKAVARQTTLNRIWLETMESVLQNVDRKIVVEQNEKIDVFLNPADQSP